ncbi:hypothetical protein Tco_0585450 [Tanacetum coccineum]
MAAFKVLETQFQMFFKSRIYFDDEYVVMTRNYFLQYTQLEIPEFYDTLIQHMKSVKKPIDKRAYILSDVMIAGIQATIMDDANMMMRRISDHYDDELMVRNSSKNMPIFSSNDIVHNHYLEEAKNKTHDKGKNSKPSVMPSARSQSTTNDCKLKPKIDNRKSRNWHASKSSKILKTVVLRWIPIGKIFESSTTKVDSESPHGSNTDITNLQECIQTLDSSAGTSINIQEEQNLDLSAGTPFNLKKDRIKTWTKDNVISGRPRLHGIASLQEISARPSSQGIQMMNGNPSRVNLKQLCGRYQDYQDKDCQGRLLASFQEDTKYEHVGQDTRSQGGNDDQDKQGKDLEISKSKTKSKDNDKGSRSKITHHEGTSIQHNKDQRFKNSTTKQSQQVQGSKIQDLTLGIRRPHIRGDC